MARARNIKPSFFTNEDLGTADPIIGLLFIGLWCLADRDGRLEDRPLRIKAELFPYREKTDVNGYLTVLARMGLILRYAVSGERYIQVVNFAKHQNPHHTEKSKCYPAPTNENIGRTDLTVRSPLRNGETQVPTRSDSLIPDSLNHDSLIPDSAPSSSTPTVPQEQPRLIQDYRFVLNTGVDWFLTDKKLAEYGKNFPTVDLDQTLRCAAQWTIDNPTRRKTEKGMPAFLTNWLTKETNKPKPMMAIATTNVKVNKATKF